MAGTDLTLLLAVGAGLLSFLSPCVLPLVPAYLGQLTTIAVASVSDSGQAPTRWTALRHGIAYVAGFGSIFTILGVGAAFAAGPLADYVPPLRTLGGILLVILGLNLAGVLRIPALERTWRPLDAGATAALGGGASGFGGMTLAPASGPTIGSRLGGRLVAGRNGWVASFGLGAIFAVGWTPCIGAILGGILGLAANSPTAAQGALLLVGYSLGLGIPFIALAVLYDRAPTLLRPLIRHGNVVSIVGGLLVVAIGLAMIFDLLSYLVRIVPFNTSI